MYRLVYLATQNWLKKNSQWKSHVDEAVSRLVDSILYGDHETREAWTAYLLHAVYVVARKSCTIDDRLEGLLSRVGRCQNMLGQYAAAQKSHWRVYQSRKERLGLEHPSTLTRMSSLAFLLYKQKRYKDASELYQRACDGFKHVLGPQHPTTTGYLNNFSAMQQEAGQAELEKIQGQAHSSRTTFDNVVRSKHRPGSASSRQGNKKGSIVTRLRKNSIEKLYSPKNIF